MLESGVNSSLAKSTEYNLHISQNTLSEATAQIINGVLHPQIVKVKFLQMSVFSQQTQFGYFRFLGGEEEENALDQKMILLISTTKISL